MQDRPSRRGSDRSKPFRTERRERSNRYEYDVNPRRDFTRDEEEHVGFPMRDIERPDWDIRHVHSYNDYDSLREGSSRSSFAGRGPKGFVRSDDRIKEEICEMLTRDPSIDAEEIEVDVKNGEVTLSGTVPDKQMKYLAEDLADHSFSVKDVVNNIRVKKTTSLENH